MERRISTLSSASIALKSEVESIILELIIIEVTDVPSDL